LHKVCGVLKQLTQRVQFATGASVGDGSAFELPGTESSEPHKGLKGKYVTLSFIV